MSRLPLNSGAYTADGLLASAQRSVNLYCETNPQQISPPTPVTLLQRAGRRRLSDPPVPGYGRCAYRATNGNLYACVGNTIYYIDSGFNWNILGTIGTFSGPVKMVDNSLYVMIVDGSTTGYYISLVGNFFGTINDSQFQGSNLIDFVDTFFILNVPPIPGQPNNQWYISPANWEPGVPFSFQDIVARTAYPDPIQGVLVVKRQLYPIGTLTTEVWYNAGAQDFTFQELPSTFIQYGAYARYTPCQSDVFGWWLSQDKNGTLQFLQLKQYDVEAVSTRAIEKEWQTYAKTDDAFTTIYQLKGHLFVQITFPSVDKTWTYDVASKQWSEFVWIDNNGFEHRDRVAFTANVYGMIVGIDWQTGRLYQLDPDYYADDVSDIINGDPIKFLRGYPHVIEPDLERRLTHATFIADMLCGTVPNTMIPDTELSQTLKAICLIPASGEFVYATEAVFDTTSGLPGIPINLHASSITPDALVSMAQLAALYPNLEWVIIVVGWFGLDLRIADCLIQPGVETSTKTTTPLTWWSGGVARSGAHLISQLDGSPAYGGTPTDDCVVQLATFLKSQGYKIGIYPFIFMDIPNGNTLPDPYSDNASTIGQPVYPWRGEITQSPAASFVGTPDKTAAAATQVTAFVGVAATSQFAFSGGQIHTSSAAASEWTFRKFILYHAALIALRMPTLIDHFVVGSEMIGSSTIRSNNNGTFPFVTALVQLHSDIRSYFTANSISPTIGYSADWSEYFGYHPQDGSNDVWFHLDPLWSSSNCDFVGIDYYPPLADWRHNDPNQLDAIAGFSGPYDLSYIMYNTAGGEDFTFFYADDDTDFVVGRISYTRENQIRTPIVDTAYGETWVFQAKNFTAWTQNLHYNRPGGVQSMTPTAWVPNSKQVRFNEFGCPAVDLGSNAPNVFPDTKSSVGGYPPFSNQSRDDQAQYFCLIGILRSFNIEAQSPISPITGLPLLDPAQSAVWCWDARPFPQWPDLTSVWTDGPDYNTGHWLEGRAVPVDELGPPPPMVTLRWSDTRGQSWEGALRQTMGATGQFYTSVQFPRLGLARDRVYELSWSARAKTALQGAWIAIIPHET